MKMYEGVEVYLHHSWLRHPKEVGGHFTPRAFYLQGKSFLPLYRRLRGTQRRSGRCGEKQDGFSILRIEQRVFGHAACSRRSTAWAIQIVIWLIKNYEYFKENTHHYLRTMLEVLMYIMEDHSQNVRYENRDTHLGPP
jgi:hypothetical protein